MKKEVAKAIAAKLLILCCLAFQAQAQVELRVDSNHVETGNPFVLQLRIPAALGIPDSLNFEAWDIMLPRQNVVSQTEWHKEGHFFSKTLTALFFKEDSLQIQALPIALHNGDTVYSNPLFILVTATPAPEDLNDMAPFKDIHREPSQWTDYLPWILGVLLALALLAAVYWIAKRKKNATMNSRSIEIPPQELALKKLSILIQKELIVNGFVKEHYAELTFILREYLEKMFGIPALESTTEETLGYLKKQNISDSLSKQLQALMEQADLAKFAKIIPAESFHAAALEMSRKIILETSAETDSPNTQSSANPIIS